jgi:hypothetical protein
MVTENGLYTVISSLLSAMSIIPNKLRESLKLMNLHPGLYILMLKAVILNPSYTFSKLWAEK